MTEVAPMIEVAPMTVIPPQQSSFSPLQMYLMVICQHVKFRIRYEINASSQYVTASARPNNNTVPPSLLNYDHRVYRTSAHFVKSELSTYSIPRYLLSQRNRGRDEREGPPRIGTCCRTCYPRNSPGGDPSAFKEDYHKQSSNDKKRSSNHGL